MQRIVEKLNADRSGQLKFPVDMSRLTLNRIPSSRSSHANPSSSSPIALSTLHLARSSCGINVPVDPVDATVSPESVRGKHVALKSNVNACPCVGVGVTIVFGHNYVASALSIPNASQR
jgi:hypothetical protein